MNWVQTVEPSLPLVSGRGRIANQLWQIEGFQTSIDPLTRETLRFWVCNNMLFSNTAFFSFYKLAKVVAGVVGVTGVRATDSVQGKEKDSAPPRTWKSVQEQRKAIELKCKRGGVDPKNAMVSLRWWMKWVQRENYCEPMTCFLPTCQNS